MRKFGAEIMWLVVLFTLAGVMGILLIGGDILLYLSPRMVPMVWFGFVILAVLSVYQLWHIGKCLSETHPVKKGRLGILMFLIPVILILTVAPNESTSGTLPNQNVKMLNMVSESSLDTTNASKTVSPSPVQSELSAETQAETQSTKPSATSPAQDDDESKDTQDEQTDLVETIDITDALPCVLEEGTAHFDASADSFTEYLYDSVEDMVGQTATFYGFIYSDDSFPDNTILVSRLYISCCAADASIVGFHVKIEDMADFEDDEWICVTGTIQAVSLEYYGDYYDFPILTDGTVTRCEAPDTEDAYVYP